MFPFDQLGRAAKALVKEAEKIGTAVARTAEDALGWAGDVLSGNVGAQAMPVPEVVRLVQAGDSSSWFRNSDTAHRASNKHSEVAAKLSNMLNNLEPAWTGKAAEGARERTKAFTTAVDSAGSALNANGDNVADSAHGFNRAKDSMEPMGEPPDKGFLDVVSPWDTDTEKAINEYNAKAQKNLGVYQAYAAHVDGQGQGLRADYGEIVPEFGSSSTGDSTPVRGFGGRGDSGDSGDDHPARSGGQPMTPTVGGAPPPGPVAGPGHAGTGSVSGPGSVTVPVADGGQVNDRTAAAGHIPLDSRTGLPLPNTPIPGVTGPGSGPGSGPTVSGVNLVGGPGGGGAAGGLGGAGKPSKAGGLPGSGRQTGARGPVEEAGRGGAGAGRGAGGRLANGPAGMAPGMGRGAKEEDKERQRKYLREDATLFTDEDKKSVDPVTGLPPTPPTIGA
ncbi:hypothetical protein B0293_37655 [Amycolatopsis azurea DSM 43854]|uniref:PE-PGRS family protein n=2 Tax=Amycolatopsis azurea TaxID=36819 RepID=M2PU45_9PSEU|nr:PE-PGRS family protein [Amycolatopsis azurea DSM 43854]OOC01330.1 hypothetical protein B0293_37655 [Amycolatopsis azurea DSM 43854]